MLLIGTGRFDVVSGILARRLREGQGRQFEQGIEHVRGSHLSYFDNFVIQTTTNHLHHLNDLDVTDYGALPEVVYCSMSL